MKSSKELHQEHMSILWRIRLEHSDGRIRCINGFSIEGGLIVCTSSIIPLYDGVITGRRMNEHGFKRYLKVVDDSTELRGVLLLKEMGLGGWSKGSFGSLASNVDIMKGENLCVTTSLPGMIGSFYEVQSLSDCLKSEIVSPRDTDVRCAMFKPTRGSCSPNPVMGEAFGGIFLSMSRYKSHVGSLLASIPIIICHKIPPDIFGSGGVVTNRDGSIVGILTFGIEPDKRIVIHVNCIMDCVKKYEDENNIKGKKHEEGKVREEKSSEKQSKQKKKWNDTRDKGKRRNYSGVTPAGEKKRLSRQMTEQYNRSGLEKLTLSRWYACWEKSCYFKVLPPPNVASALSISYAPSLAIQGDELDESGLAEWLLENQLGRNSGKVVVRPTKVWSSIQVTVAYGVTDALEKIKEIITEGIDDKIIVEFVLEGGNEFTAIVLDVDSGFDCQLVVLLPTEVELQFHGSTDLAEKDAIFNYRRRYLPKQQSDMEQTRFLFQQASKVGFSHPNILQSIIRHACSRFPAINSCNNTSSAEKMKTSSVNNVQKAFVIFGEDSSERQVSIMSGTNVWLDLQAFDDGRDLIWNGKSRWVEITVGVVGKHESMQPLTPSITVKESGYILSLDEKFQGGTGINLTPPPITIVSKDALVNCKKYFELIANTLKLEGFSRINAFVNVDTGEVLTEVNTVPGMTPSSVLIHQELAEQPHIYPHQFFRNLLDLPSWMLA